MAFWCSLGLLFGLSWAPFWPLLDPSWAILAPCWTYLGASCASRGLFWATFGLLVLLVAFCGSLGLSFKLPWASRGLSSELFWASPGAMLAFTQLFFWPYIGLS